MQIALPSSTQAVGSSWTLVPGAGESAHEDLDEGVDGNDQGATMLEQANGSAADIDTGLRDPVTLQLGALRDPGIDDEHRVRLASRKTAGAWPGAAAKLELLQGSTVLWSTSIPANANWAVDLWTLPTGTAAAITDYGALRARVQAGGQGDSYFFRISALQLEVPIVPSVVELRLEPQSPTLQSGSLFHDLVELDSRAVLLVNPDFDVRSALELDVVVLEELDLSPA